MDESGNICRTNGGNHTEEQLVSCLVLTLGASDYHMTPQDTIGHPRTVPDTPGQYQYTINY